MKQEEERAKRPSEATEPQTHTHREIHTLLLLHSCFFPLPALLDALQEMKCIDAYVWRESEIERQPASLLALKEPKTERFSGSRFSPNVNGVQHKRKGEHILVRHTV